MNYLPSSVKNIENKKLHSLSVALTSIYKKPSENAYFVCGIWVVLTIVICAYYHGRDLLWRDEGDLLSPKMRATLTKNKAVWKPRTCSIHNYTNKEFSDCWSKKDSNISLLFLGDSHERALYYMFLAKVQDRKFPVKKEIPNLFYYEEKLNLILEYEFMPIMNNSFKKKFKSFEDSRIPDLIVIGCNLHPIMATNASRISRFQHRKSLTSFLPYLDAIARRTTVLWYVQPPVIDDEIKQYRHVIRNRHVDFYNKINLEVVSRASIKLWTSAREIAIDEMGSYSDDIHVGTSTCEYYAQILSNFWCNKKMDFQDGTCWKEISASRAFDSHELCFIILLIIVLLLVLLVRKNHQINSSVKRIPIPCLLFGADFRPKSCIKLSSYISTVLIFLLTIFYVYICERIPVFPKGEVCSSEFTLICILLIVSVMSIFFSSETQDSRCVLRNCVINETKGLGVMILLISSVSNDSWKFNAYTNHFSESVFISMVGVELFYHNWCGEEMNFNHFIKKITDMNILAALLCLTLGHPYIEYGILPVTLLSYTLSYVVLASPPRFTLKNTQDGGSSSNTTFTKIVVYVVKISALIIVFTVLHCSSNFGCQLLSHPISRSLFATKEDTLAPWLFRWKIDKLSFPSGIVIGFLSEIFFYLSEKSKCWKVINTKLINWIVIAPAVLFFMAKASLTLANFHSMTAGSSDYPFLFVNLAFSLALCRSCLLKIRPKYSKILAALGPFWLEVYLLHFHIWMAFDGNAFLLLLPCSPFLNFCTTTFILLFIASYIRSSMNNILL